MIYFLIIQLLTLIMIDLFIDPPQQFKSTQNTFMVINIITHITYTNYRNFQIIMSLYIRQMWPSGFGRWTRGFAIGIVVYQWCELESRRGRTQKSNSNTVDIYIYIYIIKNKLFGVIVMSLTALFMLDKPQHDTVVLEQSKIHSFDIQF